jgi:hypothetical protein
MPDSPACHGAFPDYLVIFQSYGQNDTKPASERLNAEKTLLAMVVEDVVGKDNTHLEPVDWVPAVPVPPTMECSK